MSAAPASRSVFRQLGLATWGKASLKGNLLSSASSMWFLLFLMIPFVFVIAYGFATTTQYYYPTLDVLTFSHYAQVLTPGSIALTWTFNSLFVSVLTTLLALGIGYPVAYLIARKVSESLRGLLVSLIIVPFWVSFVVYVYALIPFVQKDGFIELGLRGIGLGPIQEWLSSQVGWGTAGIVPPILVYIWLPYMILPLFTSLLKIDKELLEAAEDLGAGPWRTFWNVTFPLSFRGVVTGSVLVFITALGSFVEPAIFAGKEARMIGLYIFEKFNSPELPLGAAAAAIVLLITVVFLYLYIRSAEAEYATGTGRISRAIRWLAAAIADRRRPSAPTPAGVKPDGAGFVSPANVRGPLERIFDRTATRHGKKILIAFSALVVLSFYIPIGIVILFSFNSAQNLVFFESFSFKWYFPDASSTFGSEALFGDSELVDSIKDSFIIGLATTGLSLGIGTPAALALSRYRFRASGFINVMLYTGLVIPSIVLGFSLAVFRVFANGYVLGPLFNAQWNLGYSTIIVGHTTFSIPIVIIVLLISLREFDQSLEEAAMNLGADEITTFFRITLPIIMPGLISAALLAFTFSFDELIVTLFLQGEGVTTMPVALWSLLTRRVLTPKLNAASTLILGLAVVFVVLANRVQKGGAMFRI